MLMVTPFPYVASSICVTTTKCLTLAGDSAATHENAALQNDAVLNIGVLVNRDAGEEEAVAKGRIRKAARQRDGVLERDDPHFFRNHDKIDKCAVANRREIKRRIPLGKDHHIIPLRIRAYT